MNYLTVAWLGGALGCSSPTCPVTAPAARDLTAAPVVIEQPTYTRLLALGDIHGGYDRLVALLLRHDVIAGAPATPADATWNAADATLVITGDLIDKGAQSLEVLDFVQALQRSATARGGQLFATLGNHEAEFLANPLNDKAAAFDAELGDQNLAPCEVATSAPRGTWLRDLPFAVHLGAWFFSHAGATKGRSLAGLGQALELGLAAHGFADAEIIGDDSLLESHDWWSASEGIARTNADALGIGHFVFGHTPGALGPAGAIAVAQHGLLFRIDTGMSPAVDDSDGSLLEIVHAGDLERATELRADGTRVPLWP